MMHQRGHSSSKYSLKSKSREGYGCDEDCPNPPPSCDDAKLCTIDSPVCNTATGIWKCTNKPKQCAAGLSCNSVDGKCTPDKQDCPTPAPPCDDENKCTIDSPVCNTATGIWKCTNKPKQCSNPKKSCDLGDGKCKNDDDLVPCVAVIDEDTGFEDYGDDRDEMWAEFRRLYPRRPFCLLIPEPGPLTGDDIVTLPVNFESDPLVVIQRDIPRDNGDETMASDWVAKCGLDRYTSANVPWVGLFIDNSSSMYEYQVAASRDLFINKLNAKNIQYKKVVNEEENWIEPFMTTLVPE